MRGILLRLVLAAAVLVALVASTSPANAHNCQGANCGPCTSGEAHNHQDVKGSCQSPGAGALVALAGVGAVAWFSRGRRR